MRRSTLLVNVEKRINVRTRRGSMKREEEEEKKRKENRGEESGSRNVPGRHDITIFT